MKTYLSIILATLLFIACDEKDTPNTVNGVWTSIGHARILEIKDSSSYTFYDMTSISCLPNKGGNFNDIGKSLSIKNDTLILSQDVMTYKFTKSKNLPTLCQEKLTEEKAKDPLYNFDVFMETIKDNYAYMELNEINYDELYKNQRAKLSSNSSSTDLFLVIEETYEKLNDNHAFFDATDDVYNALDKLEAEESDELEEPEIGDFQVSNAVAKHHIKNNLTKNSWLIDWGFMNDDMAYIQIKTMWLYADLDIPETLFDSLGFVDAFGVVRSNMYEGLYAQSEVEGVAKLMDRVMMDLADAKSIIVDVRFNGGGQDAVSYEIVSRFVSEKTQIGYKKYRYKDTHTDASPIYIKGTKQAYTKPVYVLTSPQTGSAGESFSMATLSIPHIKRIGSSTEGALSTTLDKILPIGWVFMLSSEVYMDNSGKFYENIGIPPDYEINYSRDRQTFFKSVLDDLDADLQNIMKGIAALQEK